MARARTSVPVAARRTRAEAELEAHAAVTRALGEIGESSPLRDAGAAILRALGGALHADEASLWEPRHGASGLNESARVALADDARRAETPTGPALAELATRAWQSRTPERDDDGRGTRAIAIPLVGRARVHGVVVVASAGARKSALASPGFARAIGAQIGQRCDASAALAAARARDASHVEAMHATPDIVLRMREDGSLVPETDATPRPRSAADPALVAAVARESRTLVARALSADAKKTARYRVTARGQVRDYEVRVVPSARAAANGGEGSDHARDALVLARDVSDQTRTEEELQLFLGIALATGEAKDLRGALRGVLRLVCESTGWVVGQAWVPGEGDVLRCNASFVSGPSETLAPFLDASAKVAFESGDGLPGRVHAAARPAWIRDVTEHPEYVRIDAARAASLKSGFAVPVLADTEVVAALEFYAFEPHDEDERLLTMVSAVAEQLGVIMKRKRAEEDFRLLETALQEITESILITTCGRTEGGPRIVYVSPAFSRITGYRPEDVVGLGLDVLAGPRTGSALADHLRAARASGHHFELEIVNYRKDGSEVPLEWRVAPVRDGEGKVTHFIAVQRDITQRKHADEAREQLQRALETAARQWRLTFDAIESPILMLDKEGRVLRMNRAAKLLSGNETNEYKEQLGRGLEAFGDVEPWSRGIEVVAAVLGARGPIESQVRDEARGKTWDFSATLLDETDDEKVILVVRDITRLVDLQESLRRSETMSVMGSLVAGVAHEVRNPLHAITVTLDAFEARFPIGAEHQRHIGVLRGEVARLGALMRDLLEYGKPATPDLFDGALYDVVAQAVAECAVQADAKEVEVTWDVPLTLPSIPMDGSRLAQVFQNILENAIQHTKRRGHVHVAAAMVPGSGPSAPPIVECRVADDGPGFRAQDLGRVFEPFYTRRPGGTGLGLSIVYRIVDEHGGTVSASNRSAGPGEGHGGGLITVRLPTRRSPPMA